MSTPTAPVKASKSSEPAGERPAPPQVAAARAFAEGASTRQLLEWMFGFCRPIMGFIVLACLYLSLWVGAEILTVRQTGEAINRIQKVAQAETVYSGFWRWIVGSDPQARDLRHIVLILAGLTVALAVLRYLREVANMKMSMWMVYYLREAVYDKLQRVGFAFHDAISTGQLINRALSDLQNVRTFVNTSVLTSLEILLIVGGYITLLMFRSPWVAVVAIVPLPIWTWYILRFSKKVQPAIKDVMAADDSNVSIITENIAGVHVVKAFATEDQEINKYNKNADTFFGRVLRRIRLFANFAPIIHGIGSASHLTLFLACAIFIIQKKLLAGDMLVLGAAMGAILGRLQAVATINDQYQSAIVSARRLYEVLAAAPTVPTSADAKPLPPGPGAVTFEGVTFGYDPAKPVLHDVSFSVKGGQVVAIVGPTGAGKTTLVQLMGRFYDPQKGRITIDGADVREVTLDSLRTLVSFVFQETYLFSESVEGNIAYGRPHILKRKGSLAGQRGEVEAASRLAQAHDFVEDLPKGYDTLLGERGASLSGGQRQRLAIARAILSNPRILVLDDATAAIDPGTEDLIRRGMKVVLRDRTTFIIAHRISTVKQADVVIVIENGRVTQMGTHDELMERDGHYRTIASVQLYGETEGEDEERPSHMDRLRDMKKVTAAANAAKAKEAAVGEIAE